MIIYNTVDLAVTFLFGVSVGISVSVYLIEEWRRRDVG